MALVEVVSKLEAAGPSEKQEYYSHLSKLLLENSDPVYHGMNEELFKRLCSNVLDDLKKENEIPELAKLLQALFSNKNLHKLFPDAEKIRMLKDIINSIDSSLHENILVNCFSVLTHIESTVISEDTILSDLLQRMIDVISKKNELASTFAVCNYFQKFLEDYEEKLSNFIPLLSKLVFLPLCHPSVKVREAAEKNLDMFPKILLYSSDEQATSYLLKLLKETYCKDMLQLFKEKQELYALKVWTHVVKALGNALSVNLPTITPFFQVIEKGFKSTVDEICIASFNAWKSLIDNFAGSDGVLNDSKRLRFVLKPFRNIVRLNENILSVACDAWMHLAWNLAEHLSGRFSEVVIPLLELAVGKMSNNLPEKSFLKGSSVLVKKFCYMLLRFLELPPNESFNRLSSPKKLPNIPYPPLQAPLDIKVITRYFKEILHVFKTIIDVCGTKEDTRPYVDCLMKSVLCVISTVIEDSSKESVEAVNNFLNFLSDLIENKLYPSLACLKCLECLSKLPRKVLVSHCFNCGSRKTQDILCTSLLKLLLNPHLFPSEAPKRFFAVYNRLVQAGIHESFHPLLNTHKFLHIVRSALGTNSYDVDVFIDIWSGLATPLSEVVEKTQEVNQGDKQEHDFSCMYDVLLFPVEFIFPIYVHQFRTRPVVKLWTSLYKTFIRSANLVATTATNEVSEVFCTKLKGVLKEDLLKRPHFFESFCLLMQSIMESLDFVSGNTSGTQGMADIALMIKRKKPLGNLTSFVDLLVILLKAYLDFCIDAEDDSLQSSPPAAQRRMHILKGAAPIDILKTFFGSIKSGAVISLSLERLADPISKLFMKSGQRKNVTSQIDMKLEAMWNVICSSIEQHYLGPYDSDFLAVMSPVLEATFSHTKRNLKEKSRRFWFATFGSNASSLKYPPSLKAILIKMKLPLLSEDISPMEFSVTPVSDSLPEENIDVNPSDGPKSQIIKSPFKKPAAVSVESPKVVVKQNESPKISIDDLPSEEFVKIDSFAISTRTRQRGRKRKSFVPTMYNDLSQDLSQDTSTLLSSSESQDTVSSASLDQLDVKKLEEEIKPNLEKEDADASEIENNQDKSNNLIQSVLSERSEEKNNLNIVEKKLKIDESFENEVESNKTKKANISSSMQTLETRVENNILNEVASVSKNSREKQMITRSAPTTRKSRLSQSFSVFSSIRSSEKSESEKVNKSCIELICISDSDDIIPSSQNSSEMDCSIKLPVKNGNQKSEPPSNSNCNISENAQVCLSLEEENVKIGSEKDFEMQSKNCDLSSSTVLKSKLITTLADTNEDCNDVHFTIKNKNKDLEEEKNNSEMRTYSHSDIKDLNFLLDAVDNLVNTDVAKSGTNALVEKMSPVKDIEIVTLSETKAVNAVPSEENNYSEIEKCLKRKSRNKISKNESSYDEEYSLKLRKKPMNKVTKLQPKFRKKSMIKKPVLKVNINGTDELQQKNGKSEHHISPEQLDRNQNYDVMNCDINRQQVKDIMISDKAKEKENFQFQKNSSLNLTVEKNDMVMVESVNNLENIHVEKNYMIMTESVSNLENNKVNLENIDNVESCEIFETFPSSCDDFKDQTSKLANIDSCDLQTNEENRSECSDSLASKTSKNKPLSPSSVITKEDRNAGIDVISCIPSSLEDECYLHLSKETMKETADVKDVNSQLSKNTPESKSTSDESKNNEKNFKSSLIEFSIIDDDVSCEMEKIVNSVVSTVVNENIDKESENKADVESKTSLNSSSSRNNIVCENEHKFNVCVNEQSSKCLSITENEFDKSSCSSSQDSAGEFNSDSNDLKNSDTVFASDCSIPIEENDDSINMTDENQDTENDLVEIKSSHYATKISKSVNETPELLEHFHSDSNFSHVNTVTNVNSIKKDEHNIIHTCSPKKISISLVNLKNNIDSDESSYSGTETVEETFSENHIKSSECSPDLLTIALHDETEINSIVKELVIMVEKLDSCVIANQESFNNYNHRDGTHQELTEIVPCDSNQFANKENEENSSNNKLTKGAKKRKVKPPIRSPFNFRHKPKMENSKKLSIKSLKALNVSPIKSVVKNKELVIETVPKDNIKNEANTDNSLTKIISSIVDSVAVEEEIDLDIVSDIHSSGHMSKHQNIHLSNEELTDINTRMNAQMAHQTRRIRMIADSQSSSKPEEESASSDIAHAAVVSENLSSILKKRKSSDTEPPKKVRKVSFASPLVCVKLVSEIFSESTDIEVIASNKLQNLGKKRKKILQEKNKVGKASLLQPSASNEKEDIPSSSEYQDSDVLDFNDLAVSPALINCPDDISNIIKDLTSPSWVQGLESLLASKNIKTIGDVCKLNIHQVKALPFKSPKVLTLHKALMTYISVTQEATLQKFKLIDDGSIGENDTSTDSSIATAKTEVLKECPSSVPLEETVSEILKRDLKDLPLSLLGQLVEACGKAITEKNEHS